MITNPYLNVTFLKSAAQLSQLPRDEGYEVAFVGRSNAGKSSALNTLTNQKRLARTSKTPGRTQLINLFDLDEARRLVDLPGYGYAKVSANVQRQWQKLLTDYLQHRACLKGLIVLMDTRHPLTPLDLQLIDFARARDLNIHILLTKADKLSRNQACLSLMKVEKALKHLDSNISVQGFSSLNRQGLDELIQVLNQWYEW
jgi:GTP-binding protein